jgi:hypothetical protein
MEQFISEFGKILVEMFIRTKYSKKMNKYFIKEETVGGKKYYMIYKRFMFNKFTHFYEKWNSNVTAMARVKELNTEYNFNKFNKKYLKIK